jgi:hypothetical protein
MDDFRTKFLMDSIISIVMGSISAMPPMESTLCMACKNSFASSSGQDGAHSGVDELALEEHISEILKVSLIAVCGFFSALCIR